MNLLNTLERKFGRFAIPQVTIGLIVCQAIVFVVMLVPVRADVQEPPVLRLMLIPERVLAGEVWRLATFMIVPPCENVICALFAWYLFYLMGTALERHWGTFRYNVFLLIGYVATVAASFAVPGEPSTNAFLGASVFLAFAYLCPDFELYILFLLPVKIKWLALITWIGMAAAVLFGDWLIRLLVVASVCNFLLFFGKDIVYRIRTGQRRMARQAAAFSASKPAYFHRCVVCGITDCTHPQMDFRYCSKCVGTHGYCMEHLGKHEHITAAEPAPKT